METVVRVVLIYLFILVALRIIGKRELAQMTPFELILIMFIPEISSQALTGEDYSITNAIVGLSTLLCLVFVTSVLKYRFPKVDRLVEGDAAVLVRNGKLLPETMHKERVDPAEIAAELRGAGFEKLDQIRWVVLEANGQMTVVPFEPGHRSEAPRQTARG